MSSEEEDERDWSDWGDDVDEDLTKSLFSSAILSSAKHASEHGFDLRNFRAQVGQRNAGSSESGVIGPNLIT